MGSKKTDTVGDLARIGGYVRMKCRRCGHEGRFVAAELVAFFGYNKRPETIRGRCTACNSPDVDVGPDLGLARGDLRREKPKPV
ncbi:hypothetical protein [Arenibaculum pallidiluteum]|uniref:hypothetical protein n=1 Tax=Arenibaculum pallidiluteum TaxID=2812559 RepID=UPI001A95BCFB|nr:hypothetical protein [Arenibaculum pallidiluteum]